MRHARAHYHNASRSLAVSPITGIAKGKPVISPPSDRLWAAQMAVCGAEWIDRRHSIGFRQCGGMCGRPVCGVPLVVETEPDHDSLAPQDRHRQVRERRREHESSARDRRKLALRRTARHSDEWNDRRWTSRTVHHAGDLVAGAGTGILASAVTAGWATLGTLLGFPEWWKTVLYSVTGATTFVMVFVIQHTQARQVSSMQRKLDELLRSSNEADNRLIAVEEASDEELLALADVNVEDRRQAGDPSETSPVSPPGK